MKNRLSDVNPYLRDPAVRKEGLWVSAKSSSAVEGILEPFAEPPAASRKSTVNGRAARGGRKNGGSQR
jgi:hypothetical protein